MRVSERRSYFIQIFHNAFFKLDQAPRICTQKNQHNMKSCFFHRLLDLSYTLRLVLSDRSALSLLSINTPRCYINHFAHCIITLSSVAIHAS